LKEISMRKLVFTISLLGAMMFALAVNAAAPANFAGTWTLDKAKSQGLNARLQAADSVQWIITQDGKQISIEPKVTGGQPPAGGPPGGGGGGGMGGGRGPMGPQAYNLDGTETTSEGPPKVTRKASWSSDGKTLELSSKSTFTGQDGTERTNSSNDKLALSADGKVLTVNRHSEGGRGGPQDSTLVFNK
jgi:hypothetical protein